MPTPTKILSRHTISRICVMENLVSFGRIFCSNSICGRNFINSQAVTPLMILKLESKPRMIRAMDYWKENP
jgi:hypothetical protein